LLVHDAIGEREPDALSAQLPQHKSVAEAHRGCHIQGHHRRHPIA
jgi:hypothetical protein